jgi:putative SOS response-associated peptidase YedK
MPVILPGEEWAYWLDPTNKSVPELESLLAPREWPGFEAYPVAKLVNKPGGGGPELIERAA